MDRLGRYQILDPIGSGPCGSVVRAKVYGVVGVDRQFALKQILPSLTAHAPYAQALSAAARAYGSLEHPRIARLAEFTVSQGKTFTATELVTGLDVGRIVAEGRVSGTSLAPGGALTLLSAAARAVGFAHGRGLVHLGLCPQNLIVSAEGDVKVTDFGILAACLPDKPVQEPRLAHRVAYLAPEQLVGEPTSAATDVFALGAIAIEMVTGSPAFRGETPLDVQHSVLSGQLSDPSLPRPIVKVLQRCLARAPFERFPDARAFADALDAAMRAAPVPGTRADISERVKAIMAHLAALNEGGLSGVVSLPSSMPAPPLSRPPTVLSPDEVIATPTSLTDRDRLETAEYLRDGDEDTGSRQSTIDAGDAEEVEHLDAEDLDADDLSPHTVVQPMSEASSRSARATDAPMMAATLRGISAANPPRPMPPVIAAPPPLPKGRAPTARNLGKAAAAATGAAELPVVMIPPLGSAAPGSTSSKEEVTREIRAARAVSAARSPIDPAAPIAQQGGGEGSGDGGGEVTTARHRALEKNAWDEAMESFEQPTRLNESLTASLVPSTSRTGQTPLLELDEVVLASLSDPLPRPAAAPATTAESSAGAPAASATPASQVSRSPRAASPYPSADGLLQIGMAPGPASEGGEAAASEGATTASEATHDDGGEEAAAAGDAAAASDDPQDPAALPRSSTTRVAVAPPTGPSSSMIRAIGRTPGVPAPPWPDPNSESGRLLVKVEESDAEEPPPPPRSSSPALSPPASDPGAGFAVPPLRPSDRSIPHPTDRPSERPSYRAMNRSDSSGYSNPYSSGIRPPSLPPLPMAPFPESGPVPKLTGSGARWLWMVLGVAIVAGSAAAAYAVFGGFSERGTLAVSGDAGTLPPTSQGDAGAVASHTATGSGSGSAAGSGSSTGSGSGSATATGSGSATATASGSAAGSGSATGSAAGSGSGSGSTTVAATGTTVATEPAAPGEGFSITSNPPGARVYIDGADQGPTPLKLPGPPDRHTAVLFLAGYELATLELEKPGSYAAELKEVTPLGGPAGIKVRCKAKDRYYVSVDGKPTGALCPTERLEMSKGEHVVEIYDLISETRRQFNVNVKETSRSQRVRVD